MTFLISVSIAIKVTLCLSYCVSPISFPRINYYFIHRKSMIEDLGYKKNLRRKVLLLSSFFSDTKLTFSLLQNR